MNISAIRGTENLRHLIDDGRTSLPNVNEVLDLLEQMYGPQRPVGPTDPFEMIVYLNCGYPASDASCLKGFDALKREVGLNPREILAAPKSKLVRLLRLGGIVPELRADRLHSVESGSAPTLPEGRRHPLRGGPDTAQPRLCPHPAATGRARAG